MMGVSDEYRSKCNSDILAYLREKAVGNKLKSARGRASNGSVA
jgi:hypothetical protein